MIGSNNDITVPLVDLVRPHLELEEELLEVFRSAMSSGSFIGGPMVETFEEEFAHFCGTKYCIGVGSGTDALRFSLIAAGVGSGDVVVTVPNTFIATTEAISQSGAVPAFVDIDRRTYNMDPLKLQEYVEAQCEVSDTTGRLTDRKSKRPVRAIVPVHLYGQMADMDPILELAERHSLLVIEDACQAHGAEYFSRQHNRWKKAGSIGRAAAFSFYAGKNLGACGEGGGVTTNDEQIARRVRMLRDHGQAKKYYHEIEGYNGRLDAIQAGILAIKLKHLPRWNEERREKAFHYNKVLCGVNGITVPYEPIWSKAVYHLYVIRVHNRDGLKAHLSSSQIATGIHYPIPLHLQEAYRKFGYARGDFPISEESAMGILTLPMYPQLEPQQQSTVLTRTLEFVLVKTALRGRRPLVLREQTPGPDRSGQR